MGSGADRVFDKTSATKVGQHPIYIIVGDWGNRSNF